MGLLTIVRRCANILGNNQRIAENVDNRTIILQQIYNIKLIFNERRFEIKSSDELEAEMEAIEQKMVEVKKHGRTNARKEAKRLCKEFGATAGNLKGLLAEGQKKS